MEMRANYNKMEYCLGNGFELVIVRVDSFRCVPGFECSTNAVNALVNNASIVKINAMIASMVGNVRSIRKILQIPLMFLFAGLEASSGFTYVVPRTVFTWNFVNNIALKIQGLSELWRREFLLKGF